MKKKPAVRHRLSTVQRIFFSYVFICLVPVVILAGVLAVSTFRAQQREDAARQAHTAELAARTLDAEFKRVQGLGQQLSETQWVKRRGAAAGLYDEEFGLREKLAICGDLRGYTAASGVIRQLSVVFPEKEEVYSSAGFYDTADFFRTFSLEKGQTPLESAVVYERLSLPENSGLVCGAQLGMTGGAASRLFFAEAMEYNRPMRSFLLVELDRSAIRNQIALLRTDDMLSLSIRGADRELAGISFTARAAEADYTYRSVCFPGGYHVRLFRRAAGTDTKRLVYRRAGAYFSAADGESGVAAYKADLHPAQAAGRQRGTPPSRAGACGG